MIERLSQLGRRFARRPTRTSGLRPPPPDWRAITRQRTVAAAALLAVWAIGIEARLVHLQIFERDTLVARAERRSQSQQVIPGVRGNILDRQGHVLAMSVDVDALYADPSDIDDKAGTIGRLCDALGDCTSDERRALLKRFETGRFTNVRRRVTPAQAEKIGELKLVGVRLGKESRRFYPNKELAAHVLGFVGDDNHGLSGIEWAYDSRIRGKDGEIVRQKDGTKHFFKREERPATAGATLELTIDDRLQQMVERELAGAVQQHHADGGSVIIMDPRTGNILAMANEPTFDPNEFGKVSDTKWRNRAIQDLYEPGSTFKIVTVSAAIEEKVMALTAMIDTSPGILRIGKSKPITEYDHHNYGLLSFTDVLVKSSNVGAAKIGLKIGSERLDRYVRRFGFGSRVSPDFPSESPGIVWRPEQLNDSALARVSMGYQVAVTPLQVAAAFSAVANGGIYVEPRIVGALYKDNRRLVVTPKSLRRVINADTAATLTSIMEAVVEDGTGKLAKLSRYAVAGKTGTASKLINGAYAASQNNVSFAGFLPANDPVITVVVMIDSPRAGGRAGGAVAAPIFQRIAESAVQYLGIQPTINPDPPVLVARAGDERPSLTAVPVTSPPVESVVISTPPGTVPDLRGMSGRDAMRRLAGLGVTARLSGNGFVVGQEPAPGTPIEAGIRCRLFLDRTVARGTTAGAQP